MFSPRTYYGMIERYNEAAWPGQLATLVLGVVILWLVYRPAPDRRRIIAGIVAVLWAFVAGAFLWRRYATINWAATYFAGIFAIEAVLLVRLTFRPSGDFAGRLGIGLFVFSLAVYPLLAPLLGRGWRQIRRCSARSASFWWRRDPRVGGPWPCRCCGARSAGQRSGPWGHRRSGSWCWRPSWCWAHVTSGVPTPPS